MGMDSNPDPKKPNPKTPKKQASNPNLKTQRNQVPNPTKLKRNCLGLKIYFDYLFYI